MQGFYDSQRQWRPMSGVAFVVAVEAGTALRPRFTRHFAHVLKPTPAPVNLESHTLKLMTAQTAELGEEAQAAVPQLVQASMTLVDLINNGSLSLPGGRHLRAGIHELSCLARVRLQLWSAAFRCCHWHGIEHAVSCRHGNRWSTCAQQVAGPSCMVSMCRCCAALGQELMTTCNAACDTPLAESVSH